MTTQDQHKGAAAVTRRGCLTPVAALAATLSGFAVAGEGGDAAQSPELFPAEAIMSGAGFPALAMFRRGDPSKPLTLFVPGGSHLARIFYGHPGGAAADFLCTHISSAGFSVLALSYPTAHPTMRHPVPAMSITQWADSNAAIAAEVIRREKLPPRVVAMGWSLGGRVARNLAVAFRRLNIDLEIFMGLAGVPPIPGFGGLARSTLRLSPEGLLDGSSFESPIYQSRDAQLDVQDAINGRVVIPRDVYAAQYVTDCPINFRGERERYRDGRLVDDIAAAVEDQGTFDYAAYPLCGSIVADGPADGRHSLTNAAAWAMVNTQALYFQKIAPFIARHRRGDHAGTEEIDPARWAGIRALMDGLMLRMLRRVDGSHFFFVGEKGASATAAAILSLVDNAAAVKRELTALVS